MYTLANLCPSLIFFYISITILRTITTHTIIKSNSFSPRNIVQLVKDVRNIMQPYTAINLKERKTNQLKDFISVAGPLGVTHLLIFKHSDIGCNLRIIRLPRGPTLTFRVAQYSLMSDVLKSQKKPFSVSKEYNTTPLVVMNNFSGDEVDRQLMSAMFQNMFPPINVGKMKLLQCRRVVLFHYDKEKNQVQIRHYVITASPVGLTKSVKKIIKARLPSLNRYEDISDYVLADNVSDSEGEDTQETRVTLAENYVGRGNKKSQKSAVRLREIGPRLTLELIKIEEGVGEGRVIHHSYKKKSQEEIVELEKKSKLAAQVKAQRRAEQESRVKAKQAKKQAKKERRKRRMEERKHLDDDDDDDDENDDNNSSSNDDVNDVEEEMESLSDNNSFNDTMEVDSSETDGDDDTKGTPVKKRRLK